MRMIISNDKMSNKKSQKIIIQEFIENIWINKFILHSDIRKCNQDITNSKYLFKISKLEYVMLGSKIIYDEEEFIIESVFLDKNYKKTLVYANKIIKE